MIFYTWDLSRLLKQRSKDNILLKPPLCFFVCWHRTSFRAAGSLEKSLKPAGAEPVTSHSWRNISDHQGRMQDEMQKMLPSEFSTSRNWHFLFFFFQKVCFATDGEKKLFNPILFLLSVFRFLWRKRLRYFLATQKNFSRCIRYGTIHNDTSLAVESLRDVERRRESKKAPLEASDQCLATFFYFPRNEADIFNVLKQFE